MPLISQLPAAATLTGDEELPLVQDGVTVRTTIDDLASFVNSPLTITTPEDLPNLLAWYDAGQEVYSGASFVTPIADGVGVSKWGDLSGNGYHIYETATASQPLWYDTTFSVDVNGNHQKTLTGKHPGVNFVHATGGSQNANGTRLVSNASSVSLGGSVVSAFAVATFTGDNQTDGNLVCFRASTDSDNDWLSWSSASAELIMKGSPGTGFSAGRGGAYLANTVASAALYRVGSVFDGTNVTMRVNNRLTTSQASTGSFGALGTIGVGGWFGTFPCAGQCRLWSGCVSEIVICAAALTADEVQALDSYFSVKWGM